MPSICRSADVVFGLCKEDFHDSFRDAAADEKARDHEAFCPSRDTLDVLGPQSKALSYGIEG